MNLSRLLLSLFRHGQRKVELSDASSNPRQGASHGASADFLAAMSFSFLQPAPDEKGIYPVPNRVRLLPDGEFSAVDGRPGNMEGVSAGAWVLDAANAAEIIADFNNRKLDLVIDYEHQTESAEFNGKPAPAAGFIKILEYRQGAGLIGTVAWTENAVGMISKGEYQYISPVFSFDAKTGRVSRLFGAGLVNRPGLNSLGTLHSMAALRQQFLNGEKDLPPAGGTRKEGEHMELKAVLHAAGLPAGTSEVEAISQLEGMRTNLAAAQQEVAALKASQFDPAKHVDMSAHAALQAEVAALKASNDKAEREGLIQAGLSDGRILPSMKGYWENKPIADLKDYLNIAQPSVAALSGTQTGGVAPAGAAAGATAALSAEEMAYCQQQGLDPKKFAETLSQVTNVKGGA